MSQDTPAKKMTNRDIKATERRQQILDTAKHLFAANGYHATSMRTINKKVGMSEALTYHYFPGGKSEILDTIIREAEKARADDIDESIKAFPDEISLREALSDLAKKLSERFEMNKEYYQILVREKNMLSQEQWAFLLNVGEQFMQTLVAFLEKRAALGQIREMDFMMAASQFLSHIGSLALHQIMFGPGPVSENYLQMTEKIVDFTVELWSK